jgi:hypothetical protein
VLIDVSTMANEVGFRLPVAPTRAAWERCVTVPRGGAFDDEAGRLWDVLWVLMSARPKTFALLDFGPHHPRPVQQVA